MAATVIEGPDPRFDRQKESTQAFSEELETLAKKHGVAWFFIGVSEPAKIGENIGCAGFLRTVLDGATPEQFVSMQEVIDRAGKSVFESIRKKVIISEIAKALTKELSE